MIPQTPNLAVSRVIAQSRKNIMTSDGATDLFLDFWNCISSARFDLMARRGSRLQPPVALPQLDGYGVP